MNIRLSERARKHLWQEVSRYPELVPVLAWATAATGPTGFRDGWRLFFSRPEQRPHEWMVDVGGLSLSVHPGMQSRLEGKTLDFADGQLLEV